MRCHDVTRLQSLYLDSELSPETSFAVAEHLEDCPTCRARVGQERQLEEEIRGRLIERAPNDAAAWERAMREVARRGARGHLARRVVLAAAGVGVAAALLFAALLPQGHRELDLARSAAADHARFTTQVAEEDLPSVTLEELGAVASRTLRGSPLVPAGLPAGYRLLKIGRCNLDGAPVAYLILASSGEPVSLFLMDRGELSRFPDAAGRLAKDPAGVACDVEGRAFYLAGAPDRLACGVGKLDTAELERLVLWLLRG